MLDIRSPATRMVLLPFEPMNPALTSNGNWVQVAKYRPFLARNPFAGRRPYWQKLRDGKPD
jgi:hypothetical protein